MFVPSFLVLFSTVSCLTRSFVDYDTTVGNCTFERPVFGSMVSGGDVGCFPIYGMVRPMSYQRVQFFNVNRNQWFVFRFISLSLSFDGRQWIKTGLVASRRRVMIVPKPGQLLYARDRYDRHVFFRSFGELPIRPTAGATTTNKTPSSSTKKMWSTSPTSATRKTSSTNSPPSPTLLTKRVSSRSPTTKVTLSGNPTPSTRRVTSTNPRPSPTPLTKRMSSRNPTTKETLSENPTPSVNPTPRRTTKSRTVAPVTVRTHATSVSSTAKRKTLKESSNSRYFGFFVLLLVPLFFLVWKKGKGSIQPLRIRTQRFFNAAYDEDMDALVEEVRDLGKDDEESELIIG